MKSLFGAFFLIALTVGHPATSNAAEWKGHLSTLSDASTACASVDSNTCLPFLAQAVAVADVLHSIATPSPSSRKDEFKVIFQGMQVQTCSKNWFDSLNGQSLPHAALGLSVDIAASRSTYWSDALLRASRQLCRA